MGKGMKDRGPALFARIPEELQKLLDDHNERSMVPQTSLIVALLSWYLRLDPSEQNLLIGTYRPEDRPGFAAMIFNRLIGEARQSAADASAHVRSRQAAAEDERAAADAKAEKGGRARRRA